MDNHSVARLVIGGEPACVLRHHPAALFRPGDYLQHGLVEVRHEDKPPVGPGSQQGRLVEEVFQVGSGEAGGGLGHVFQDHVLGQGLLPGMDLENLLPALDVGQAHVDLPVEPAGAQQGGVQNVLPVGGGQNDHALVGGEAVHLHQQLVQGLFPLVVAAAQAGAPLAAYGVDLVNEDNGGGILLGLVEVPDAAGAHAHIELHKVGARDGQEVYPGLAGHRLGDEGLTGARRAHQQHALGDAGAQGGELLGVPEELHNLLQLLFLLVRPGHVVKGDLFPLVGQGAGAGVAESGRAGRAPPAAGRTPLAHHQIPEQAQHRRRHHIGDEVEPPGALHPRGIVVAFENAAFQLLIDQLPHVVVKEVGVGHPIGEADRFAPVLAPEREGEGAVLQREVFHLLLEEKGAYLAVGGGIPPVHLLEAGEGEEDHQGQQNV